MFRVQLTVERGLRGAGAIAGVVGNDGRFQNTTVTSDEKNFIE